MTKFKMIFRSNLGALIEGFVCGEADVVESFTVTSAEDRHGDPFIMLPELDLALLSMEELAQLKRALRDHELEERKTDGDRPYRVPLDGRMVDVYVKKLTRPSFGRFDPFTSVVEAPEGASADIILIRDAETNETIDIAAIPEEDYERLVDDLVTESYEEEAEVEREYIERHEPDNWLDEAL